MASLRLGPTPKTIKFLLFAFNLLFVITGIILLSLGVVILGVYHQYKYFLDHVYFSVPSLLVAVGSIIFIIAFFGCCGVVRESYCMIITFCTLLVIAIFMLEIIGGMMGYLMRTKVAQVAQEEMLGTMPKYIESYEIQLLWDNMQRDFDCCGTRNASDWIYNLDGLPMSCCDVPVGAIGVMNCTLTSPTIHNIGCIDAFVHFAEKHAARITGVGIGLGVVQLIGIFLSSYLAKSIKNGYQTM